MHVYHSTTHNKCTADLHPNVAEIAVATTQTLFDAV